MPVTINGTTGITNPDGSAGTPSLVGTDSNTGIFFPAADTIAFAEGGAEAMRIDSSGNLLVGTTSSLGNERLRVVHSLAGTSGAIVVESSNASFSGHVLQIRAANTSTNNTYNAIQFSVGAVQRFKVQDNGNVNNTNNSYGAISDAKLKENVTDATPKLDKLNLVRVVNYNLIGQEQKQIGVIAQELEQIFPGMIDESPDRDKDGNDLGTTTKSVKYSVFVPMLIKAIQEQTEITTALTARITALEGTP